jgi:hypothetical protein
VSPGSKPGGLLSSSCPRNGDPDGCCPRYLPLDRQASLLFLFRVVKLVGDGGNAPLVVFRACFATAVLQTADRNITHGSELVETVGVAPTTNCLQGSLAATAHVSPNWHGVLVPPQPRRVLETQLRELAHAVDCGIGALGGSRTRTSALATRCSAAKPQAPGKWGQEHNAASCGTRLVALCSCPDHNKERTPSHQPDAGVATGFLGGTFWCFGHTSQEALIVVIHWCGRRSTSTGQFGGQRASP